MTQLELNERLEYLTKLKTANPIDVQEIFKIYRVLFGDNIYLCSNCPASIRQATDRLRLHYNTTDLLTDPNKKVGKLPNFK